MKKTKISLIMLVAIIISAVLPMNSVFALSGAGIASSPYVISSEADLHLVRNNLSANYILGTDISLTSSWSPIGSSESPFTGIFDGNGFAISGLTISASGSAPVAGLFGYNAGEIKNLEVEISSAGITVTAKESAYAGGITAVNDRGIITNCQVNGNITVTASTNENTLNIYAGLIAGKSTGPVLESFTSGQLTVSANASAGTKTISAPVQVFAGGLVGLNTAAQETNFTTATVQVTATSETKYSAPIIKVGGALGENYGDVKYISASGDVSGTATTALTEAAVYAGGLIGKNVGLVEETTATGAVLAKTNSTSAQTYGGGLIGYTTGDVSQSFATGEVTSESTTTKDTVYAGGLVGLSGGVISESYAVGQAAITATGATALKGGLVGYTSAAAVNSYYRNDSSYTVLADCGTAKTEEELKTAATFTGWDFTDTWEISPLRNNGYPRIKALGTPEENVLLGYSNGTITVETSINIESATLIAASYNANGMEDYDIIEPFTLTGGQWTTKTVKENFKTTSGGTVKIMLWKDMDSIMPICDFTSIQIGE